MLKKTAEISWRYELLPLLEGFPAGKQDR